MGQRCSTGSTEEAGQTGHREPIMPADMGGPFVLPLLPLASLF